MLEVRAGSITTLASPFSLLLTGRTESSSTQRCRARRGNESAALWWWGGSDSRLLGAPHGAGNKVCVCVCVCACVCVCERERGREREAARWWEAARQSLQPVTRRYRVSVCAVFTGTSEMLCQQQDGGEAPLMHTAGKERDKIRKRLSSSLTSGGHFEMCYHTPVVRYAPLTSLVPKNVIGVLSRGHRIKSAPQDLDYILTSESLREVMCLFFL